MYIFVRMCFVSYLIGRYTKYDDNFYNTLCFLPHSERLFAEKETNRSQALWAAGYALMEATRQGDPVVNVQKVLKAIEDNSGASKFNKFEFLDSNQPVHRYSMQLNEG